MAHWLWKDLRSLFEVDDGSLPEVCVTYVDVEAPSRAFALLRDSASSVLGIPTFWSIADERDCPVASVPNAAVLVCRGAAESFHVVLEGVRSRDVTLPDLGVFVFPDQLALDYRMGSEWTPVRVEAFFALLADLAAFDPRARISLPEGCVPEDAARFQNAWPRWSSLQGTPPDSVA